VTSRQTVTSFKLELDLVHDCTSYGEDVIVVVTDSLMGVTLSLTFS